MPKFGPDEAWKKVFGPVFIYVNSVYGDGDPFWLWEDAKEQVPHEKENLQLLLQMLLFHGLSYNKALFSDDD